MSKHHHLWDENLCLCFIILVFLLFQSEVSSGSSLKVSALPNLTFSIGHPTLMSDGFTRTSGFIFPDLDGTFAFGFLSKSFDAYTLSIWLDIPSKNLVADVVWSANRNQPVNGNGSLTFVANGSLVLNDGDGREVWSTHTDGRGGLGLELQDSGNLAIYNQFNKSVWQSFDFPTDSLLQGQVLSSGMRLISSISDRNLSEGSYSLRIEPGGLACYVSSTRPLPYWIWASRGKNDTDSLRNCHDDVQLTLASNRVGLLLATSSTNSTSSALCSIANQSPLLIQTKTFLSNYTRFLKIESDGNMRIYVYNGALNVDYDFFPSDQQCRLPGTCGPYGLCSASSGPCSCPDSFLPANASSASQGCYLRAGELTCNQTMATNHKLVELSGVDYFPDKFVANSRQISLTKANCMNSCLQNCSCTASFFYGSSNSCFIFTDPLQTLEIVPDQTKLGFIKVKDQQLPISKKKQSHTGLVAGVIGSLVAVSVLSAIFWYRRKKKAKTVYGNTEDDSFIEMVQGLTRFSYSDLHVATEGFRKQLGAGGFGAVYEGSLGDGTKIAVKKLEGAGQGQKEFKAEVATIGSIHHINLVRLRGFCSEGVDRLLVYEYMPNGSLDKWLSGNDETSTTLNWQGRFEIAKGTARGLAYLHGECRERIIHLDIKPQNILLDESFVPKIADFGLSKLVDRNQSMVYTMMRGTPGYLAPEWLHAAVTEKTDVFSYGMVLLQLITGRKVIDVKCTDPENQYLPGLVLSEIGQGRLMEVVDKRLHADTSKEEVELLISIAFLCIKDEMESRPSMDTVVQMLEGRVLVPHLQLEAYKFSGQRKFSTSSSSTESSSYTNTNSNSNNTTASIDTTHHIIHHQDLDIPTISFTTKSLMHLSNPR
ncbi:hypothetical protein O6H91_09G115100 [Diphasiastrum complanatum]|uniref:Uncharacterized protein n=1 Tax=Diphasiastrum complanatum TaxID=34168 RepID=A0ACC2CTG9_DIPCM|nr:hypothetical protein O6H91_09G115100 [Diphasiastrum complanatum]